jgi:hypothetical protein
LITEKEIDGVIAVLAMGYQEYNLAPEDVDLIIEALEYYKENKINGPEDL